MAWVVDTSVVLDIHIGDPAFEPASTACLQSRLTDGLVICPISFVEIGPSFGGDFRAASEFLQIVSISTSEWWTRADTQMAHLFWHEHQIRRRQVYIAKRPVADVMIAAFAMRFQGIITRNADDFREIAPAMTIVVP